MATSKKRSSAPRPARTVKSDQSPSERPREKGFPVIGIGASAGGLEAFSTLFRKMPQDTGMAFILIQHIEPSHVGNMVGLIQRQTAMPVVEVKDNGLAVEPNHLYMIPPNREISVFDGRLKLGDQVETSMRHSIDLFFRSLAEDLGERAICIILSGTGSDGTAGARAIKAQAGLVIAQDPDDAAYEGMPRSAVDAGVADMVLPAADIAGKLVEYVKEAYGLPAQRRRQAVEKSADLLKQIFSIIRSKTRRDFSGYKPSTIRRRIERRMGINHIEEMNDYVRLLKESSEEVSELTRDFLIQVTSFFRDPEAFESLKPHMKALIRQKGPREEIRAWTVGCSTGEEAYSVAMIIDECLREMDRDNDYHVFGTDLDSSGIDMARSGIYPESITADVTPERLKRYFAREESRFRVNQELRQKVVFAVHDIITDPPFSRLDLVSARNLLIYLDSNTQKKVIPVLHYGLRDGGILFMGTAETIGEAGEEMFETLDRKWRIYRARNGKHGLPPVGAFRDHAYRLMEPRRTQARNDEPDRILEAERALVSALPPAVVVDKDLNILYVHGETGKYLQLSQGSLSNNLLDMARDSIKVPLATATHRALTDEKETTREGIRVRINGDSLKVKMTVRPITGHETRLVVIFEDSPWPKSRSKKRTEIEEDERYRGLEQELQFTRESLRSTVEELETSNEELRSTVEEFQSTNEELNSTNEELESSREELQSMNEELTTVNAEHSKKIEELSDVSDDMKNLLNSTEIATIFLDQYLLIKRFTPAASEVLNIRGIDVGRPISDITSRMKADDLAAQVQKVLDTLVPSEIEAQSKEDNWYSVRIVPYRTSNNSIEGAVISFIDISRQKNLEVDLRDALDYANRMLDAMHEPMAVLNGELKIETVNDAFLRTFGVDKKQTEGRLIYEIGNGQWNIPELKRLLGEILPENSGFEDFLVDHEFPQIGRRMIMLNARRLEAKDKHTQKILLAMEDVTGRGKKGQA